MKTVKPARRSNGRSKIAAARKKGRRLIIEPARPTTLLALLANMKPVRESLPRICDRQPDYFEL